MAIGWTDILLRFGCALLVGVLVGMEREFAHRPAGLRTHMLVSLGACAVTLIGEALFWQYLPLGHAPDPTRLSAQVISGVGFLGAGTIMRDGFNIKGLTTAASLWAVACLGIGAGAGQYPVVLVGSVGVLLTLSLVEVLQQKLPPAKELETVITITCRQTEPALQRLDRELDTLCLKAAQTRVEPLEEGWQIRVHLRFEGRKAELQHSHLLSELMECSAITAVVSTVE